jgi:hypothetical protein
VVIEFRGMIGAGKTTCVKIWFEELRARGINCRPLKLADVPVYQWLDFSDFSVVWFIYRWFRPRPTRTTARLLLFIYVGLVKNRYAKTQDGVFIADEGVLQKTGTLRKYARMNIDRPVFAEINCRKLSLPDVSIDVWADFLEQSERKRLRDGRGLSERFSHEAQKRKGIMERDLEMLRVGGGAELRNFSVDNTFLAGAKRQLAEIADALFAPAAGQPRGN